MAGNGADETESEPVSQLSERDYLLRRFEAVIGFWKVVVGTALVGLASVLIPGAIQFWELQFKERRQEVELNIAQDEAQRDTITQFIDFALNEDIELRIRMAEYFSIVSEEAEQTKWAAYFSELVSRRDRIKAEILSLEQSRNEIELMPPDRREEPERLRLVSLRLELAWLYGELGRATRGESVVPTLNERQQQTNMACEEPPDSTFRDTDMSHLHPVLRRKVQVVLSRMEQDGIPFRLFEGYRSPIRQQTLYARGRTAPGNKVTSAAPWQSVQQFGLGADLVLYMDGKWDWGTDGEKARWWQRMHEVALQAGLEVLKFEPPHVQLPGVRASAVNGGNWPADGDAAWLANIEEQIAAWRACALNPPAPEIPASVIALKAEP